MKKAFYSSLSIHLLVFILISITLPEIKTKEIDYIAIEIINEEIKGFQAIVYQHEIDHLDGFLFTDKVYNNDSLVTYDNYVEFYEKNYKQELINFFKE